MKTTIAIAVLASACVGTETGNPITSEGTTSDSTTASLVATDGVPVVEEVWISVAGLRAILGPTCDHVGTRQGEGPVGDLLTGLELEAPVESNSCGVHIVTAPAAALPAAPDGFEGSTGMVIGRRSDGTRFELRTTSEVGINVQGAPGVDLEGEFFVLSFDVARWIAAVDLSVSPDPDGVVRISNPVFDGVWVHAAELYVDANADGNLDAGERAAGPVATSH